MTNPSRRLRRQPLHLPRSAWPIFIELAGVGDGTDKPRLEEAFQATHDRLVARLADRPKRSEVRWQTYDADDARDVMRSLGINAADHTGLLAFLDAHPLGKMVLAYADAVPMPRRYTILG